MTDILFNEAQLDEFGAKLEGVLAHFTDDEQQLLSALINRGIAGVHEDGGDDVSGFALLLPAVQKVREAAHSSSGNGMIIAVRQADGSVMPTDQFSLNFLKIGL